MKRKVEDDDVAKRRRTARKRRNKQRQHEESHTRPTVARPRTIVSATTALNMVTTPSASVFARDVRTLWNIYSMYGNHRAWIPCELTDACRSVAHWKSRIFNNHLLQPVLTAFKDAHPDLRVHHKEIDISGLCAWHVVTVKDRSKFVPVLEVKIEGDEMETTQSRRDRQLRLVSCIFFNLVRLGRTNAVLSALQDVGMNMCAPRLSINDMGVIGVFTQSRFEWRYRPSTLSGERANSAATLLRDQYDMPDDVADLIATYIGTDATRASPPVGLAPPSETMLSHRF